MDLGANLNNYKNDYNLKYIIEMIEKTRKIGANIFQMFLGNKSLTTLRQKYYLSNEDINTVKALLKKYKIKLVIHSLLSLNYCNDPKSPRNYWGIENLVYDMNLCEKLGGIGCIIHMGTRKTKKININVDQCIKNYIKSLITVFKKSTSKKIPIILETPVNRENIVGGTIEEFANLYNLIPKIYKDRVKICVDTQHIFSSGYNINTLEGAKKYFEKFDTYVKIKNIKIIHLNDSKVEFNSKINRHAPIGNGYIFSDKSSEESLKFIINLAIKNKIPLILETHSINFSKEIKMIKNKVLINKVVKNKIIKGGLKQKNIKKQVLEIFNSILSYYETLGKNSNIQTKYKISSYQKAIKTLENFKNPIYSSENVKNLEYIGKGMCEKIDLIAKNGTLEIYENIKKNKNIKSIKLFQEIWGIGPELAKNIVSKGILNIKDLINAVHNKKIELTYSQKIGLKYYNDLKHKIPHDEITYYTNIIKDELSKINNKNSKNSKNSKNIQIINAGSYRSLKNYSGDIDLIVSYKNMNIEKVNSIFDKIFKKMNLIHDILSKGLQKCIYIIKDKSNLQYKYFRKMDIAFVENENVVWYLLYFGSSRDFSKKIRSIASKKGYKLSEKGLFNRVTGEKINFSPKNEKDIFNYLEMKYLEPKNRT